MHIINGGVWADEGKAGRRAEKWNFRGPASSQREKGCEAVGVHHGCGCIPEQGGPGGTCRIQVCVSFLPSSVCATNAGLNVNHAAADCSG
jgi:hypothetical protein